jgi:hypothetical protein
MRARADLKLQPHKAPNNLESFPNRTKYPVPTLSSRKKVAGSREPMKLDPLETAVNKKFGPDGVPRKPPGGPAMRPRARKITS